MHAHQIPSIEALESDLNRLLETRLVPGAAASHAAIPQLMYLKSRSAPRARTTSQSAANDVTTREAVEQAIEDLGESDDGKVARALFDARGPLGFSARIKNAADALGVNEKTIRRDRQRRALRAVALRMIRSELEFLAAAVSPLVLYGQDPLIRALWSTQADAEIILTGGEIPAAIPHSKGAYSVQAGDVAALLEAYANLVGLRDQASISVAPSSEVHGAKLGCNIVSIGGPRWNVITRNLLGTLEAALAFLFVSGRFWNSEKCAGRVWAGATQTDRPDRRGGGSRGARHDHLRTEPPQSTYARDGPGRAVDIGGLGGHASARSDEAHGWWLAWAQKDP